MLKLKVNYKELILLKLQALKIDDDADADADDIVDDVDAAVASGA